MQKKYSEQDIPGFPCKPRKEVAAGSRSLFKTNTDRNKEQSDLPVEQQQLQALESLLKGLRTPLLAFSGGLDSRFLAYSMHRLGIDFTAVHVTGPHLSPEETTYAQDWLKNKNIPHRVVTVNPLDVDEVKANGKRRCYHCKHHLFSAIISLKSGDREVLDGSNASDTLEYRPGRQALEELGVISPLAACGINKETIYMLAEQTGMDNAAQAARPCLLTRFAYDLQPDTDTLARLGRCEDALATLGLSGFRLRIPARGNATLQIPKDQTELTYSLLNQVEAALKAEGFEHAALRFSETVSGSYDKGIL